MDSYTNTNGILPFEPGHKRTRSQIDEFDSANRLVTSNFGDFPGFGLSTTFTQPTFLIQPQYSFGIDSSGYGNIVQNIISSPLPPERAVKRARNQSSSSQSLDMNCLPFFNHGAFASKEAYNRIPNSNFSGNDMFDGTADRPGVWAQMLQQTASCSPCGRVRSTNCYAGYQPTPINEDVAESAVGYVSEKPPTVPSFNPIGNAFTDNETLLPMSPIQLNGNPLIVQTHTNVFLGVPETIMPQTTSSMMPVMTTSTTIAENVMCDPSPYIDTMPLCPNPSSNPFTDFASTDLQSFTSQAPDMLLGFPESPGMYLPHLSTQASRHIDMPFNNQLPVRYCPQSQFEQDNFLVALETSQREFGSGTTSNKSVVTKRGPFKNTAVRQETAKTRILGSCVRCRMQRIRCKFDPNNPAAACLTCEKAQPNTKIWRLPCLRYKIPDVQLFKPSNGVKGLEWTKRWSNKVDNIATWQSTDIRTIRVSEGYTSGYVELKVREFRPLEGDKLTRTWVADGQKKQVLIPAYAICDISAAQREYRNYIKNGIRECIDSILQHGRADDPDAMLMDAYSLAYRLRQDINISMDERMILDKTLQLWMSIRLTTKSTIIIGDETLGMTQDIMDHTSPLHGKIPLPPVMGAQIDLILIEDVQKKLRRELLDKLQKMTQANNKKTWLTLYLVTFILLHNIAMITAHDAGYARKHGLNRRFAREEKVREYHLGANILLAYFHYCNKGLLPFSNSCSNQKLRSLAELDDERLDFVHRTRQYVAEKQPGWDKIRNTRDYENDFYFISQMFQKGWTPINSP